MKSDRHPHPGTHYHLFTQWLTGVIQRRKINTKTRDEGIARQRAQVEGLVQMERDLRVWLAARPNGLAAYAMFVTYITEERRNILDARPFFRERNQLFVEKISPLFKARDHVGITAFDVNYQFFHLVDKRGEFTKSERAEYGRRLRAIEARRIQLAEENFPLAVERGRMFARRARLTHMDLMDVVEVAAEGLMAAIDKFHGPYTPVFRSVIINRLTGSLIAANSATLMHYFPGEKRKLYRARKALGSKLEVDMDVIVQQVGAGPGGLPTTPEEISQILCASAPISADTQLNRGHQDDDDEPRGIAQIVAPSSDRPDYAFEEQEAQEVVGAAIATLTILEQKLLRMRGVAL